MSILKIIREIVLSNKILYETFFFLTGKKLNRKKVDKKITKFVFDDTRKSIKKLVVSLTSYGDRVNELKYTLFSLVNQTIRPEKILVWLSKTEFSKENLPKELLNFENYDVEFKFCDDIKSYKKLIFTLEEYHDYYIITADDDLYYKKDWLEKLWNKHIECPNKVVTHIAHEIKFSEDKLLLPYKRWKSAVNKNSCFLFPTTGGGVLYHKSFLYKDVLNIKLFSKLSPKADDVWFYFMVLSQGTEICLVDKPYNKLKCVDVYKEYGLNDKSSLQHENVEQNLNDVQIRNIMSYYNISDLDLYNMIYEHK